MHGFVKRNLLFNLVFPFFFFLCKENFLETSDPGSGMTRGDPSFGSTEGNFASFPPLVGLLSFDSYRGSGACTMTLIGCACVLLHLPATSLQLLC